MAVENNSGNATIGQWWRDSFVQALVEKALDRTTWTGSGERERARLLIEHAIKAADEGFRHGASRRHAWAVLSRIYSIVQSDHSFGNLLSFACGFPPMADGTVRSKDQIDILEEIADAMEGGFQSGLARLQDRGDAEDAQALAHFLAHLQKVCEVPTALSRATAYFYSPTSGDGIGIIPPWWSRLTVERWADLLEDDRQPKGALHIRCANSLIPVSKGINALVSGGVDIEVGLPEEMEPPVQARLSREAGGRSNARGWDLTLSPDANVSDEALPVHRSPARYSAESPGLRKATLRVVSLQSWEPGIFVYCRTATKISAPRKAKKNREGITYESSLVLEGEGRHFLDLYVGPQVSVGSVATGRTAGIQEVGLNATINAASESAYGVEIKATAECNYDVPFTRGAEPEILRLQVTCEESATTGCSSEFERLIRLNRATKDGGGVADVQIDRQVRVADLQAWLLAKDSVERSFYPCVLAPDYASAWRPPEWKAREDAVFSRGKFVHDPRPTIAEMTAPEDFARARAAIATRIRGDDENGLVEASQLGVWLATDTKFAEEIEEYVRSYLSWLDAEPESAAWVDVVLVNQLEGDYQTLVQDPEAILISPLHPLRLGWHCLAQRTLYLAYKSIPCPAASILDPDSVPDTIALPLRSATGEIRRQVFLSVECSSDYWAVLWNASRLDRLGSRVEQPPIDKEFGLQIGGVSSAFSVSQVHRALDDVSSMLSAKPVLNIAIASAAGQSAACNEGIISWCKEHLGSDEDEVGTQPYLGDRLVQIYDDRKAETRPEEAEISNLAEDTRNSVRWFGAVPSDVRPDLGIVAQLEVTNPVVEKVDIASPVGTGALIRHRIRRQLAAGEGAFLCESRMGIASPPSGEGLADKVMHGVVRIENLSDIRLGYTFAPSVHAIQNLLKDKKSDYAAVSSSAVDPACFLGEWLKDAYLWDYDLPSYSNRAGDTNGYYLLSQVKDIDRETLKDVLSRLPAFEGLDEKFLDDTILEVARRGIPTVRGLSAGDSGASGDLGMLIASRLLQDEFRRSGPSESLLPAVKISENGSSLGIVLPVDPFHGYLDDLQGALGHEPLLRPDLLVAGITISDSSVTCRITPIEVKLRSQQIMSNAACTDALKQAQALSKLLMEMKKKSEESDLLLWRLALQHLILSMVGFGFRVYSQHRVVSQQPKEWAASHQRFVEAVVSNELDLQIDMTGRLVVIDRSPNSAPRDHDNDGFSETIVISAKNARDIVASVPAALYVDIRAAVGNWNLLPAKQSAVTPPMEDNRPAQPIESIAMNQVKNSLDTTANTDARIESIQHGVVSSSSGIVLDAGNSVDGFKSELRQVHLSDTKLNQLNIGVVGDLGTGKTQLLKSLVYQLSQASAENQGVKPRILIFDYKNDYGSEDFVKATGAGVVKPYKLPINMFDLTGAGESMTPWLDRFKFFSDVLDKIFKGIGPIQRQQLKQAVRQSYEESGSMGRSPTIYDVHAKYKAILGNKADAPLAIIDDLVDMEMFAREPGDTKGFDKFLDGVVVIALNALGQDDRTKNMLVAVMLNMFYEHMLRIQKRPFVGKDPQLRVVDSFLLVDEADNIMMYEFDVLRKLLLQGREFGVGVILASQYLRHFKAGATDYREPLLTWFIHKVPNITSQELSALGLTADAAQLAERVKTLPNHQCLVKTVGVDTEVIKGIPFFEMANRSKSAT
jgi:hypothetical protein